jgi:hypothetical protein
MTIYDVHEDGEYLGSVEAKNPSDALRLVKLHKRSLQRKAEGKPLDQWTPGRINNELDRLDKISSRLTDKFIAAGRGYEKPLETLSMNDSLALEYKKNLVWREELRNEIARRWGPNPPRRLPTRR